MPETAKPSGLSFPNWTHGSNREASMAAPSGTTKRVTTEDDIRISDINDLRAAVEALSLHSHYYYDDRGSC